MKAALLIKEKLTKIKKSKLDRKPVLNSISNNAKKTCSTQSKTLAISDTFNHYLY